jgi:hypothetical protein
MGGKGVQLQRIFVPNYIKQLLALIIRFCQVMSVLGNGIPSFDSCLVFRCHNSIDGTKVNRAKPALSIAYIEVSMGFTGMMVSFYN